MKLDTLPSVETRPKSYDVFEDIGLIDVTTPRQRKNGTYQFKDPIVSTINHEIHYATYKSGYVRRIRYVITKSYYGTVVRYPSNDMYQLNRRGKVGLELRRPCEPFSYRIMEPSHRGRANIVVSSVISFRHRNRKTANER